MRNPLLAAVLALGTASAAMAATDPGPVASPAGAPNVASSNDGKYFDAAGNPTYKIGPDGKVDWYTFSGYRRFNGACETCHGFDGSGSSFAPDLTQSLKTIGYADFQKIVINGKQSVNTAETLVMPAFGTNKNVMCYLDDIYVYLRVRRWRPRTRPPAVQRGQAQARHRQRGRLHGALTRQIGLRAAGPVRRNPYGKHDSITSSYRSIFRRFKKRVCVMVLPYATDRNGCSRPFS